MAPTARLPPKKDVALALLEQASMYIHLDPRAESVQVPAWFKKQPQLVLQVGLNMPVPIRDLNVDDSGISCTLSFSRSPFFCVIPWPSVFALVGENGQAMVWAEDVPAEVAAQAQAQRAPEKPRAHLRSVGEGETAPAPEPAAEEKKPTKAAKAGAKTKAPADPNKSRAKASAKPKAVKTKAAPKVEKSDKAEAPKPRVEPALAAKPEAAKQARPEAAPAAAPSSSTPRPDSQKPKRELPPYLRVVK